jgi:spore coat protein U-like protein
MRKFTKFTAFLAAVLVLTMGGMAMAGTDTGTFGVTADIAKACVVGTGGTMAFGSLALLDADSGQVVTTGDKDATGTFYTACTNGSTTVTFAFAGVAGTGFAMTGAGETPDTIAYTLFSDSGYTAGIAKSAAKASSLFDGFAADGANHQLSVYGRIALADMVAKKVNIAYSDTVTVTVSFD